MDDESFAKILEFFSLSSKGYRKVRKGVKKRIGRHMRDLGFNDVDVYLNVLRSSPREAKKAAVTLTVTISRFFRDRRLWEVVRSRIIPALARTDREIVRVWSAGCSCGEEVYSFKILWDSADFDRSAAPTLQILATDMNPEALEKARAGSYPSACLREIDPSTRKKLFRRFGDRYEIDESFKRGIDWLLSDFTADDPPGDSFDIVFLRNNLLTYYESAVSLPAIARIAESLRPGGFLVIGEGERISTIGLPLKKSIEHSCILSKTPYALNACSRNVSPAI